MNNLESKVAAAYEKYGLAYNGEPRMLSLEEKNYRIACMFEEIEEFAEADTLVDSYDAILDLIVFAVGTLHRMGMPLQEGFDAVMKANLSKEVGNNPHKKDPNRGQYKGPDLVKPAGFIPPEDELCQILINHSVWKKDQEWQRSIATPIAMAQT